MDFFNAAADDLKALKWAQWDSTSNLWLCPEKQFADLPDGIALHSISGEVAVKGRDAIDDDTRFGCLAYGIIPGKTRTDATALEVATRSSARAAEFLEEIVSHVRVGGMYVFDNEGVAVLYGDDAEAAIREMHPPAPTA